jgi:dolichol-phosphate hexosyltransferase
MRVTLVIPTLNEAGSIGHVLETFRAAAAAANGRLFPRDPLDWEILVIDGNSTDGTSDRARALGATVLVEPRRGYGRAYRTGFAHATGEIIATMDGDGTYPAERIPGFIRQLLDEHLDFITGDRLTHLDRKAMSTEHRIGNWALNSLASVAYHRWLRGLPGRRICDSQSGMWVFRRSILEKLRIGEDGMTMSEEIKLEVLIRGYRFLELPIPYAERWGAPKLSTWVDGRKNLTFLLRKRLALHRELQSAPPLPRPDRAPP